MTDTQAEHAQLFGETSRRVMRAIIQFGQSIESHFSVADVSKMFIGAGAWLMCTQTTAGTAALLRELAEMIERGERPTVN